MSKWQTHTDLKKVASEGTCGYNICGSMASLWVADKKRLMRCIVGLMWKMRIKTALVCRWDFGAMGKIKEQITIQQE